MLQALHHSNFSAHLIIIKRSEHTTLTNFQYYKQQTFTDTLAFLKHTTYPWLIHIMLGPNKKLSEYSSCYVSCSHPCASVTKQYNLLPVYMWWLGR